MPAPQPTQHPVVTFPCVSKNPRVKFKRTRNWYSGEWAAISEWCDLNFGDSQWGWDHIGEYFYFQTEKDRTAFLLAWGTNNE